MVGTMSLYNNTKMLDENMNIPGLTSLLILTASLLKAMGRPLGSLSDGLWTSSAQSSKTSQLIADPYTFTHIVHGILFYWIFSFTTLSPQTRLLAATTLECLWEILENTPLIINRYRTKTVSLGYSGDSIINSLSDIVAMILGYGLAASMPWWASVFLTVLVEVGLVYFYKDNLTLSIWMLLSPSHSIKQWQLGLK